MNLSETDQDVAKKVFGDVMGDQIGRVLRETKDRYEDAKRLNDQRYENTVERLTKIDTKLDQILEKLS